MFFSIPPIVYSWVHPYENKGEVHSHWDYLFGWLRETGYVITKEKWEYFFETMFWSAGPSLVLGWVAQYLVVLAWEAWRQRTRRGVPAE